MYCFLSSFLKIGVIFADFKISGKTPFENEQLIILAKGADTKFRTDLKISTEIWFRSVCVFFKFEIMLEISCGVTGKIAKELEFLSI